MSSTYLFKRLLWAVPTLFGVAVIVFVLLRVVPGDPIAMMVPPGAHTEDITRLRELYGLNASLPRQFGRWIWQVAQGDFGHSISLREKVSALVLGKLPATLELVTAAMLIAVACGLAGAMIGVYFRGQWPETAADSFAGVALAIPDFLWALLFVLLLGVLFPILPVSGRIDPSVSFEPRTGFYLMEALATGHLGVARDIVAHLLLPAAALALPLAAGIARV